MQQGDVRWYQFAKPNKRRPVVILTRNSALEYLGDVTVAQITSRVREIPTEVLIGPDDGLPNHCAINLDHVQTIPKSRVGPLIAQLSKSKMEKIGASLLFAFGFPPKWGRPS